MALTIICAISELPIVAPEYIKPIQNESFKGNIYAHPHSRSRGIAGNIKNPYTTATIIITQKF